MDSEEQPVGVPLLGRPGWDNIVLRMAQAAKQWHTSHKNEDYV
jgi:Asp-tRNA(Asn)/Glu-tRNA(Gln) amidotransferase A subunit family amidase